MKKNKLGMKMKRSSLICVFVSMLILSCTNERYSKKYLLDTYNHCVDCITLQSNLKQLYPNYNDYILLTFSNSCSLSYNGKREYIDVKPEIQYLLVIEDESDQINGFSMYEFNNIDNKFNFFIGYIDKEKSQSIIDKAYLLFDSSQVVTQPLFRLPNSATNLKVKLGNQEFTNSLSLFLYDRKNINDFKSLEFTQILFSAIMEAKTDYAVSKAR